MQKLLGLKKSENYVIEWQYSKHGNSLCILTAAAAPKKSCGASNNGKTYSEPFVLWQNIINVFLGFVTTVQVKIISSQAEIHSGHHSSCFENKFTN